MRLAQFGFLVSLIGYLFVFVAMLTVYLGRALRRVYRQGWMMTTLKTVVLFMAYFMLLNPVIGAAVVLVLWRLRVIHA